MGHAAAVGSSCDIEVHPKHGHCLERDRERLGRQWGGGRRVQWLGGMLGSARKFGALDPNMGECAKKCAKFLPMKPSSSLSVISELPQHTLNGAAQRHSCYYCTSAWHATSTDTHLTSGVIPPRPRSHCTPVYAVLAQSTHVRHVSPLASRRARLLIGASSKSWLHLTVAPTRGKAVSTIKHGTAGATVITNCRHSHSCPRINGRPEPTAIVIR